MTNPYCNFGKPCAKFNLICKALLITEWRSDKASQNKNSWYTKYTSYLCFGVDNGYLAICNRPQIYSDICDQGTQVPHLASCPHGSKPVFAVFAKHLYLYFQIRHIYDMIYDIWYDIITLSLTNIKQKQQWFSVRYMNIGF